ncbi:MAG: sugar phosphate isomerase/epimerase family protein [bacterium]|nr:sugar phosphate isomerase/epimerase family protein [bacterium]
MKLSTTINFFLYEDKGDYSSYFKDLKRYADLGFCCLDAIFCSAAAPFSPLRKENWKEWAKAIREEADRLGITFVQTHLPYYNFCDPKTGIQDETEEWIRRSIVCTQILGAYWTVSHPATDFASSLIETSKEKNLLYFRRHLDFAKEHQVGICMENMADFPEQGYPRSYCASVEELRDLVLTLRQDYENVGICWDFGHANLVYQDQVPCLEYLRDLIKVTHVHDNYGKEDEHKAPYLGTVNWEAILPVLKSCGYQGNFSYEVKRMRAEVPDQLQNSLWRHLRVVGEYLLSL